MQLSCNFFIKMHICEILFLHCGSSDISKRVTKREKAFLVFSTTSANFAYGIFQSKDYLMLAKRIRLIVFLFSELDHFCAKLIDLSLTPEVGYDLNELVLLVNMAPFIISIIIPFKRSIFEMS